jgi:hypothetical protein
MWGLTIYLMRLADYLKLRKENRRKKESAYDDNGKRCRVCGKDFDDNEIELDKHMRKKHPSMI